MLIRDGAISCPYDCNYINVVLYLRYLNTTPTLLQEAHLFRAVPVDNCLVKDMDFAPSGGPAELNATCHGNMGFYHRVMDQKPSRNSGTWPNTPDKQVLCVPFQSDNIRLAGV